MNQANRALVDRLAGHVVGGGVNQVDQDIVRGVRYPNQRMPREYGVGSITINNTGALLARDDRPGTDMSTNVSVKHTGSL